MKKTILSITSMLFFSAIIIAQPTLTSTNFTPLVGESQLYYVADTNSILDNTIGANVTFNYTGLQTYGMQQTQYYIDPTTTTYSSDFPSATFSDSTSGFAINKNYTQVMGTDSLMNVGLVANNAAQGTAVIKYNTDPEKTMEFPFTYGNFFIDDYSGVFSITISSIPVNTNGSGQATVNADAWGTLQLPLGLTIDSVLRVKTIENLVTDTIFSAFGNILPVIVNAEYVNYYKPSISKHPLLSFITGSTYQNGALLDSVKAVITQFSMPTVGIENLNIKKINLSLYPNPASNNTSTLSFKLDNNAKTTINVLNSLGQYVQNVFEGTLQKGSNKIIIKTANLSRGLYFVSIMIDNKMTTQKLLIE